MNIYEYVGEKGDLVFTKAGIAIAYRFIRIVHGGRGAYVEIPNDKIILQNLYLPEGQEWRIGNIDVYYVEMRSMCETNAKLYFQQKTVEYADYKIGCWYVSPRDLQDFEVTGKYEPETID